MNICESESLCILLFKEPIGSPKVRVVSYKGIHSLAISIIMQIGLSQPICRFAHSNMYTKYTKKFPT